MKIYPLPIVAALIMCVCLPTYSQESKVVGEAAEHMLSPVAKEAAERVTKELVKGATADAGARFAEQSAKALDAQLSQAAEKYGTDVLAFARRVPEASTALAVRTPQLLPLAEQFGDDILRLEARAPGFGELAAESYGKDDVPRLLRLGDYDMKRVIVLATHATEPRAASLLLEGAEKGGGRFLERISAKQILATGLSVAVVVGAYEVSSRAPGTIVEKVAEIASKVLAPVSFTGAGLLAVWGGLALWRRHTLPVDNR